MSTADSNFFKPSVRPSKAKYAAITFLVVQPGPVPRVVDSAGQITKVLQSFCIVICLEFYDISHSNTCESFLVTIRRSMMHQSALLLGMRSAACILP